LRLAATRLRSGVAGKTAQHGEQTRACMSQWAQKSRLWRFGRPLLRVGRIAAASGSLYMLGYSNGMRRCLEDRDGSVKEMMSTVLSKQASGSKILSTSDSMSVSVSRLGAELLSAAQGYLKASMDSTPADDPEADRRADKLKALQRLHWQFIVIDDDVHNAFVVDLLPGYVFVHRGLVETMNEEELSFIIAHELSHYLCEHGSTRRGLHGIFSVMQILLLSTVDPTGLFSLLFELPFASALFSAAVSSPLSRQHERDADALGLTLVARACRDPSKAIRAHEQLAAIEASQSDFPDVNHPFATHPPILDRLDALRTQLPTAMEMYEQSGCTPIKYALKRAGLGSLYGDAD